MATKRRKVETVSEIQHRTDLPREAAERMRLNQLAKTNSGEYVTPEKPASHNDQFLILAYTIDGTKVEVYILKPGDYFEGFGGSRHALQVVKTHSLIIRTKGPHGLRDVEYDVHNRDAWNAIFDGYALGLKDPERAK